MKQIIIALVAALVLTGSAVANAPQDTQTLDVEGDGFATERTTGDSFALEISVEGDLIVTESGHGVDRTTYTQGPALGVTITIDGTDHEIDSTGTGEGVSLVQTGVNADAWRLSVQGAAFDGSSQFRGGFTLLGTDEGYTVSGDGVLTLTDGPETVNYELTYSGTGTFE